MSVNSRSNNDSQSFTDYLNQGLGGFYEIQVDANGNYILVSTNKKGVMTQQQFALYFLLKFVISYPKTLKLNLGNTAFTMVGDYASGTISMTDVRKIAESNQEYLTAAGALGHEIFEQAIKQFCGFSDSQADYLKAHAFAMIMEDQINGSTRGKEFPFFGNDKTINYLKGSSDFGRVHYYTDRFGNLQNVEQVKMNGKWDLSNFKNGR